MQEVNLPLSYSELSVLVKVLELTSAILMDSELGWYIRHNHPDIAPDMEDFSDGDLIHLEQLLGMFDDVCTLAEVNTDGETTNSKTK
jgi:hypothetical protein